MSRLFIQFCLAICFLLPLISNAREGAASNTEFQIFKAQTEAKIEAAKESQQKDLQLYQQLVTSQNERIEQINHQVDWLGHLIALGSIIVTLLLVGIGYFAYGKAKSDAESIAKTIAKDEANTTSKAEVKKWFDDNLVTVNNEISALNKTLKQITKEVDAHAAQTHRAMDESNANVRAHASQIIADHPILTTAKPVFTETDKQTLEQANTSLQNKPESEYSFNDWDTRAYTAYSENNFSLATEYWKRAAQSAHASNEQVATALINQGVALDAQKRFDESIACYQQIIQRFGTSSQPIIQERVAMALVNLGVALGNQNKHEEAIDCCQKVVQRFGNTTLPSLQIQVANALINQGVALSKQDKPDEAIACCLQVAQRFGDSKQPAMQDRVAYALNGHGFTQLVKAKRVWGNEAERTRLLTEVLTIFERAKEIAQINSTKSALLGNISYTLWLLGETEKIEPILREALMLGGEDVFHAEIEDTKISPVPSDVDFEKLVKRLWSEISIPVKN